MRGKEFLRLISGFRKFREKYFEGDQDSYRVQGPQHPKALVIGCSDSRVDPAILTSAGPGDLFVVRNVANLVPPFEKGGGFHGVSAAIEFAVVNLKVENIVVLGHRQCGGIHALVTGLRGENESFVERWVSIARPAHFRALAANPHADAEELCKLCELEAIKISIENLRTFPFVKEAELAKRVEIIGMYFDIESGRLLEYNESKGDFVDLNL